MSDSISSVPPPPEVAQAVTAELPSLRLPQAEPRLRLWPGVVIVALQWLFVLVPAWFVPGTMFQIFGAFLSPIVGAVALVGWWLFASRLRWADRGLGLLACGAVGLTAFAFAHPSLDLLILAVFALPAVTTAWVLWLLLTPWVRWPARRAGLLLVFVLTWGYFSLVRFEGVNGLAGATFRYRWDPTAEELFLAELATAGHHRADAAASRPPALQAGDWPGFRGPDRDGRRTGVRIATDWGRHPPREVWRHRVGPGWSSFAVVGTRLYTQEQWGDDEAVVCYDAHTGVRLWAHRARARFTEKLAGPGPRATPTFHEGNLYTLGAAGRVNCLDAVTGRVLWTRDLVADTGAKVPMWGFASSPLVVKGVVTVFAGGPEGKSVVGYNAESGKPAWFAPAGGLSYCSPQPALLGGAEQVLLATDVGVTALDPARGKVLWEHGWPLDGGARIVQPALLGDSDVLLGTGFGTGTRRLRVRREGAGWAAREVWTSRAISPYFNDLVVHKGHLYGFDANFFTCVSLEDGKRAWRARGYGNGQVLLLADQDLLLVVSEQGEVALVEASPTEHRELGRFQALPGKSWNHPVVAHGKLFLRNGEEAVCYQLAEATAEARPGTRGRPKGE
jgi:outer membrane protein assembly factor BamB